MLFPLTADEPSEQARGFTLGAKPHLNNNHAI